MRQHPRIRQRGRCRAPMSIIRDAVDLSVLYPGSDDLVEPSAIEKDTEGEEMISRQVRSGSLGINMNVAADGILVQTTEDVNQARVVLGIKQAEHFIEQLRSLVATLIAARKATTPTTES